MLLPDDLQDIHNSKKKTVHVKMYVFFKYLSEKRAHIRTKWQYTNKLVGELCQMGRWFVRVLCV